MPVSYTHLYPALSLDARWNRQQTSGNTGTGQPQSRVGSVSYTHLDLYKRQVVRQFGRNCYQLRELQTTRVVEFVAGSIHEHRPVSYTHLQKFSFALPKLKEAAGSHFAVIIDEAHTAFGLSLIHI